MGLGRRTALPTIEVRIRLLTYTTKLEAMPKGRVRVPVPFDPNEVWA